MCSNTVVSYYCSCLPGYTLSANGTSCNVATSSCVTSKMNGLTETINPTTMQSNSHIMMTSPSVTPQSTPNAVYAQVRFLNVVNCASFTIPAAIKLLRQSVNENVNEHCKCNFTIESADVICYDITRVTLRGTVRLMQLPYLRNWVMTIMTSINLQGSLLKVGNGCPVQIESLDDPECPIGNMSAQEAVLSDATDLTAGIAFGGVLLVVIIAIVVLIAVLLIKSKKRSGIQT
ncbi:hypothetical protein EMCRGX_G010981 [Ephydatia muelleri]